MFTKILVIGIDSAKLETSHWSRIDTLGKRVYLPKESPRILNELADTDCLLVNFGVKVGKEEMDAAPKLKYIGVYATAFGKVDVGYAKQRGIVVTNTPGYSTEAVAEFVIAALLEQLRQLEKGRNDARNENYSGTGFKVREIKNKTFGIIGLGQIGAQTAQLAKGFGAHVIYWSKNRKLVIEKQGITYSDLDSLLENSDFISINVAQTPETEAFFNEDRFQKLKKGTIIVNTVPMDVVHLPSLENWLIDPSNIFILDHPDEMKKEDAERLSKYANCIVYPPIAYLSEEALATKREMFVESLEGFVKGKPVNRVN